MIDFSVIIHIYSCCPVPLVISSTFLFCILYSACKYFTICIPQIFLIWIITCQRSIKGCSSIFHLVHFTFLHSLSYIAQFCYIWKSWDKSETIRNDLIWTYELSILLLCLICHICLSAFVLAKVICSMHYYYSMNLCSKKHFLWLLLEQNRLEMSWLTYPIFEVRSSGHTELYYTRS